MTLSRVYIRSDHDGSVHARVRSGLSARLFSPEACRTAVTSYVFVADLKTVALNDLCRDCFPPTDAGAVLEASYASERDPEDVA